MSPGGWTLFVVVSFIIDYACLSTLLASVGWMYGNAGKRIDLLGWHT
jgi:hypothetical protein